MFPYDPILLDAVETSPQSIAEVIQIMQTIAATCVDGDGLKWFNELYLQVTQAVQTRVQLPSRSPGTLQDAAWIATLDVQFAKFYFAALRTSLSGDQTPGCWQTFFNRRNQTELARIQFALAGVNAHIDHDLPQAIVATCKAMGIVPAESSISYTDYTALNTTLDGLIETAKKELHVRLLGDALPPVGPLEDSLAAWGVAAARETAWTNAEILWHLAPATLAEDGFLDGLSDLTTLASETLLMPVV